MADSGGDIMLIEDHGPVRVLTLNRPSVLNAVSPQLGEALRAALAGLDADPGVQTGIITGAGTVPSVPAPTSRRCWTPSRPWAMATGSSPEQDSADALEGPRAFAEKRPPRWQGRLADEVVAQVADVDPEVTTAGRVVVAG
jgi:hypothetical protein